MNWSAHLLSWSLLAQQGEAGGGGSIMSLLPAFLMIGILFYFLIMRPEKRRRAEMAEMLKNLKKNDRIVTIGGIYGVVANTSKESDEMITIRVEEGRDTKLRILRTAISRVITDDDTGDKKSSS